MTQILRLQADRRRRNVVVAGPARNSPNDSRRGVAGITPARLPTSLPYSADCAANFSMASFAPVMTSSRKRAKSASAVIACDGYEVTTPERFWIAFNWLYQRSAREAFPSRRARMPAAMACALTPSKG